jgi:16S rRNA (cytosine1402-N4)-methyltransferase
MNEYHIPVMLNQCLEGLNIDPDGTYVDATFGGGGHAREILARLNQGRLIAFDQDADAERNLSEHRGLLFIRANFRYIRNFLRYYNIEGINGILADLGVSSHDFDQADRGFSFRFDAPLDMRMNRESQTSAATILAEYDAARLTRIFREFGEIKNAASLSNAIIMARMANSLTTTGDLLDAIRKCIPKAIEKKYLAQVFQSLRMEVNDETGALRDLLTASLEILRPGGRIVILTYHSIEDRMVKNFFRSGNFEGKIEQDFFGNFITPFELINRKVIIPSEDEIETNPRSRSAKLRIAEKKETSHGKQ